MPKALALELRLAAIGDDRELRADLRPERTGKPERAEEENRKQKVRVGAVSRDVGRSFTREESPIKGYFFRKTM